MEPNPSMRPTHQPDANAFPIRADHLGQWLLDQAAGQIEWPMEEHQGFLDGIARAVGEATDSELSFPLPPDAPKDPVPWNQGQNERRMQLGRIYAGVGEVLLAHLTADALDDAQAASIRDALIPFGHLFGKSFDEKIQEETKLRREQDIRALLADSVLVERAGLLFPPIQMDIFQHWLKAREEDGKFFEYSLDGVKPSTIRRSETYVETTLRELHDGEFNYPRWYRMNDSLQRRNVLHFLVGIRLDIPEGNAETLKQLALEKVNLLPDELTKSLLIDHCGLGEAAALSYASMGEKYNLDARLIGEKTYKGRKELMSILGTKVQDEL
jgi:hypothetical protein